LNKPELNSKLGWSTASATSPTEAENDLALGTGGKGRRCILGTELRASGVEEVTLFTLLLKFKVDLEGLLEFEPELSIEDDFLTMPVLDSDLVAGSLGCSSSLSPELDTGVPVFLPNLLKFQQKKKKPTVSFQAANTGSSINKEHLICKQIDPYYLKNYIFQILMSSSYTICELFKILPYLITIGFIRYFSRFRVC
jgi:hypothetical protein